LGTLQTLARFQGKEVDPRTEEEPGRILHEMRFGDTPSLALGGGRTYYGTVDATPLFVMLVGELSRWGNRREEVDALLPAADDALQWITDYGDKDGDGYVEYQRTTDRGLQNQGWKDSWDSMRFVDGALASPPIALCEVQGYVYAALVARGHCATEAGDHELAASLTTRADVLKERFNRDFWVETPEGGYFAIGLDRDKRKIDGLASNMGHCLWTGIVDEEKAPFVAQALMSDDMFSGWGIRTLAESNGGYNPISYHCGSVWPHDNALAAAGLMRYGFATEAHRVMRGMVDASRWFGDLLPELFGGMPRAGLTFPVSYPTSCSPQAWAAASPLLFLRTLLRFEPDIRASLLHLAPAVPESIGTLRLERIPIMGGFLSVEVTGEVVHVLDVPPGLTIVSDPRAATR
jgi:glycogen debranching enzyme